MTPTKASAAKSVFWSGLESGGAALLSFGSLLIYAHLLSPSAFGLFAIVLSLVELLAILATMLFHDALIQREEVTERHYDTAFTVSMVISLALMSLVYGLAEPLSAWLDQPDAVSVLRAMSLYFPFSTLGMTIMARERRSFRFRTIALRTFVGRLVGAGVGLSTAFLGWGVWSLVGQQLLIPLSGAAVLWIGAQKRPALGIGKREFLDLFHFGKYAIAALFLSFSVKRVFTIVSGVSLGVVAAGYLNLAFRMLDVLWSLSATALQQVLLPMLSRLQSDPERLARAYRLAVALACAALYPCFIGIGLTAPEVTTLFGEQWSASAPYAAALSCLILLQAPRLLVGPMLSARGRPRDTLFGPGAALVFLGLATTLFGIPSLWAAVALWMGCEAVSMIASSYLLSRQGVGLKDQLVGLGAPLLAVTVMALGVGLARLVLDAHLASLPRLAVLASLGAALYPAALWIVDRKLVLKIIEMGLSAVRRQPVASEKAVVP